MLNKNKGFSRKSNNLLSTKILEKKKFSSGFDLFVKKSKLLFLEQFYWVHLNNKNKEINFHKTSLYQKTSNRKFSITIRRAGILAFVVAFGIFTALQLLFPKFFNFNTPGKVYAADFTGTNTPTSGNITNPLNIDASGSPIKLATQPGGVTYPAMTTGGYGYLKQITITNNTGAQITTSMQVAVPLDHKSLVAAGKSLANGDDLRVFYWNGSSYVELNRFGDNWNSADVATTTSTIWFKPYAAINNGSADSNYYFAYGKPTATNPPTANVFTFFDDFSTLDTTNTWTNQSINTVTGSALTITKGGVSSKNALGYNLNSGYSVQAKVRFNDDGGASCSTQVTQSGTTAGVSSSQFIASSNTGSSASVFGSRIYTTSWDGYCNLLSTINAIYSNASNGAATGFNVDSNTSISNPVFANGGWHYMSTDLFSTGYKINQDNANLVNRTGVTWAKNLNYIVLGNYTGVATNSIISTSYDFVRVSNYYATPPAYSLNLEAIAGTGQSQTNFQASGSFESAAIDSTFTETKLTKLYWSTSANGVTTQTTNTNIQYQISTSPDNTTWSSYVGPDGTANTFFTHVDGTDTISALIKGRYFKYKAFFATTDTTVTPNLTNVSMDFVITLNGDVDGGNLIVGDGQNYTMLNGGTTRTFNSITVRNGGILKIPGATVVNVTNGISLTGNSQVIPMGANTTSSSSGVGVTLKANNINIESGSSINGSGQGYSGGNGTHTYGYGPGGGTYNLYGGGGGGYGGAGGSSTGSATYAGKGGSVYGSSTSPGDLGSGGAYGSNVGSGQAGGGAIRIIASSTFTLAGSVVANGLSAGATAGGAGGSVWITAGTLTGSGTINTDGGAGGPAGNTYYGGSGGGGRVAIYYGGSSTISGLTVTANGGVSGTSNGANGTIIIQQQTPDIYAFNGQKVGSSYVRTGEFTGTTSGNIDLSFLVKVPTVSQSMYFTPQVEVKPFNGTFDGTTNIYTGTTVGSALGSLQLGTVSVPLSDLTPGQKYKWRARTIFPDDNTITGTWFYYGAKYGANDPGIADSNSADDNADFDFGVGSGSSVATPAFPALTLPMDANYSVADNSSIRMGKFELTNVAGTGPYTLTLGNNNIFNVDTLKYTDTNININTGTAENITVGTWDWGTSNSAATNNFTLGGGQVNVSGTVSIGQNKTINIPNGSVYAATTVINWGTLNLGNNANASSVTFNLDSLTLNSGNLILPSNSTINRSTDFVIGGTGTATMTVGGKSTINMNNSNLTIGDGTATNTSSLIPQGYYTVSTSPGYDGRGITINAKNLTVNQYSKIDASSQGYLNLSGPGKPIGAAGAGYGGNGGTTFWSGTTYAGGTPYGSISSPIDLGSAGNSTGYGGGAIKIAASGNLAINGSVLADGGTAIDQANSGLDGGGSGGSIFFDINNLSGSGVLSAKGGGGASSGGKGSGGRVAIRYGVNNWTGTTLDSTHVVPGGKDGYPWSYPQTGTLFIQSRLPQSVSLFAGQTKLDGKTGLKTGAITNETGINLNFWVTAENGSTASLLTPQIEYKEAGTAFDGTTNLITGSQINLLDNIDLLTVTIPQNSLTNGKNYHWRARVQSVYGDWSNWSAYGNNPTGDGSNDGAPANTDFGVNAAPAAGSSYPDFSLNTTQPIINSQSSLAINQNSLNLSGANSAVFADSDTLNVTNDIVLLRSSVTFGQNTNITANNLTVGDGIASTSITIGGNSNITTAGTLTVKTTSKVVAQSTNTTYAGNVAGKGLTVNTNNFTIESGASFNADGQGYQGGTVSANQITPYPGSGPGGGSPLGAGGTYGGVGGASTMTVYGSAQKPIDPGSGSAAFNAGQCGACNYPGAAGGGAIKIIASGTTKVDGSVSANGISSGAGGGGGYNGGSGGSVWIDTSSLQGAGTITANGGNSIQNSYGNATGSGGGGRIAIYYSSNSFPANKVTANAGTGTGPLGAAGSVVFLGKPGNFSYTYNGTSGSSIILSWDAPDATTGTYGFKIYRAGHNGSELTDTSDCSTSTTSSIICKVGGAPGRFSQQIDGLTPNSSTAFHVHELSTGTPQVTGPESLDYSVTTAISSAGNVTILDHQETTVTIAPSDLSFASQNIATGSSGVSYYLYPLDSNNNPIVGQVISSSWYQTDQAGNGTWAYTFTGLAANKKYKGLIKTRNSAGVESTATPYSSIVATKAKSIAGGIGATTSAPPPIDLGLPWNTSLWYAQYNIYFQTVGLTFGEGGVDNVKYKFDQSSNQPNDFSTLSTWNGTPSYLNQTATSDGSWYLHVASYNVLGEQRDSAQFGPFMMDINGPSITNNTVADTTWHNSNNITYNINLSDSNSLVKEFYVGSSTAANTNPNNWVLVQTGINSATFNDTKTDLNLPQAAWNNLAQGTNYLFVKAVDNIGNFSISNPYIKTVNKDTTAPSSLSLSFNVNSDTNGSYSKNINGDVTLTISANDAGGSHLANYEISNSGADGQWLSQSINGNTDSYNSSSVSWNINNATYGGDANEGQKTVYIKFTDGVGNTTTYSRNIIWDITAPDAFDITSPANNVWQNLTSPSFTWNISESIDVAKYQLYIDGQLNKEVAPDSVGPIFATPSATLTEGDHIWYVVAVDNAGNTTPSTSTYTVRVDSIAPSKSMNQGFTFTASTNVDKTINVDWSTYKDDQGTTSSVASYTVERVQFKSLDATHTVDTNNWSGLAGYSSQTFNASDRLVTINGKTFNRLTEYSTSDTDPTHTPKVLDDGVKYTYRIKASDSAGNLGVWMANSTGLTDDTNPPTTPTVVSVTPCDGTNVYDANTNPTGACTSTSNKGFETKLSWTGSSDNGGIGVLGYKIYREAGTYSTNASDFVLVGYINGSAPANLVYFDNDTNSASSYSDTIRSASKVIKPTSSSGAVRGDGTTISGSQDLRLNDSTSYFYRVTAIDKNGNESPVITTTNGDNITPDNQNEASTTTPDVTAPVFPPNTTILRGVAGGIDGIADDGKQKIDLNWSPASDLKAAGRTPIGTGSGLVSYTLYMAKGGDADLGPVGAYQAFPAITTVDSNTNQIITSYTVNRLDEATYYYFYLTATDTVNLTSSSTPVVGIRTATSSAPSAPSNVTVYSKKGDQTQDNSVGKKVTVNFTGSKIRYAENMVTGYEVYRSTTLLTGNNWLNATLVKTYSGLSINGNSYDAGEDNCPTDQITFNNQIITTHQHCFDDTIPNGGDGLTYYYAVRALGYNASSEPHDVTSPFSSIDKDHLNFGWDIAPYVTKPATTATDLNIKVKDAYPNPDNNKIRNVLTWQVPDPPVRPRLANETLYDANTNPHGCLLIQKDANGKIVANGSSAAVSSWCNIFGKYQIHRVLTLDNTTLDQVATEITDPKTNLYMDEVDQFFNLYSFSYYFVIYDNVGNSFYYPAPNSSTLVNPPSDQTKDYSNFGDKLYADYSFTPGKSHPVISNVQIQSLGVSTATISWDSDQPTDGIVEFKEKYTYNPATGKNDLLNTGPFSMAIGERAIKPNHAIKLFGLKPNTEYDYQVVSTNYPLLNTTTAGDQQNVPTLKTQSFIVTFDEVITTTTTVEVKWHTNLPADSNFVEFQMQRLPGDDSIAGTFGEDMSPVMDSNQQLRGNLTQDEINEYLLNHDAKYTGLKSNRKYTFKIKSISTDGFVAYTDFNTFQTKSFDTSQFTLAPSSSNVAERNITSTTALIAWSTAIPTTSWVEYSTKMGVYDMSSGNNDLNTYHGVQLEGLVPGTKYFYRVRVKDGNDVEYTSQEYSFTAVLKPKISGLRITDVKPYSVVISWETNVDTETVMNWGKTASYGEKKGKNEMTKNHSVLVDGLEDNSEYHFQIVAHDDAGNEVVDEDHIVTTPLDTAGPQILGVKIDMMPLDANSSMASVIISWQTDKPSTTLVLYDEGIIGGKYSQSSTEDKTLNLSHSVIIKDLKPASSYHFKIISKDKRSNEGVSPDHTFVTPTKEQSILQLILKSLEQTFAWTSHVGSFFSNVGKRVTGK